MVTQFSCQAHVLRGVELITDTLTRGVVMNVSVRSYLASAFYNKAPEGPIEVVASSKPLKPDSGTITITSGPVVIVGDPQPKR